MLMHPCCRSSMRIRPKRVPSTVAAVSTESAEAFSELHEWLLHLLRYCADHCRCTMICTDYRLSETPVGRLPENFCQTATGLAYCFTLQLACCSTFQMAYCFSFLSVLHSLDVL